MSYASTKHGKPEWEFVIYGYNDIRNDRKDRTGGGVAIILRFNTIVLILSCLAASDKFSEL